MVKKNQQYPRLPPGSMLTDQYQVLERLGEGWEGEVYLIREMTTGIERTAKLFLPQRNVRNKTLKFYARKLHTLRHCPFIIQYHSHDTFLWNDTPIAFLVSEFIEGELLGVEAAVWWLPIRKETPAVPGRTPLALAGRWYRMHSFDGGVPWRST